MSFLERLKKDDFSHTEKVFIKFLFFAVLGSFIYIAVTHENKSFAKHTCFTNGTITDYTTRSGNGWFYTFKLKDKSYNGFYATQLFNKAGALMIGKTFPVVYDSLNPTVSHILIFPSDFKEYNKPFPLDLEWTKAYE